MTNEEAINRIKDVVEGTIDHITDIDDVKDIIYEIKSILKKIDE